MPKKSNLKPIVKSDRVIEFKRDYAEAYYLRGNAKFEQGDHEGAIADFDRVVALKSENAEAVDKFASSFLPQLEVETYYDRGLAKYNLGDHRGAIADFDRVVALADYPHHYYNRLFTNLVQDDCRGTAYIDRGTEIQHDYAKAYCDRGNAKSKLGGHRGAIADYSRAIGFKPDYAEAYYERGNAKSKLGDHDGAEADRKRAIELNPELKDR